MTGTKQNFNVKLLLKHGRNPQNRRPPQQIFEKYHVHSEIIQQRPFWTIEPHGNKSNRVIFFLHGGAYIQNFQQVHWKFLGRLVDQLKCTVVAPDYPLAPEDQAPAVFAMLTPLYQQIAREFKAENMTLMGDSAGGGLALALAQQLQAEGIPQPASIMLISPWLDITMTHPGIATLDKLDPILSVSGLIECGAAYAGTLEATDYRVSPIYGPLTGLAPLTIFVSTHELFHADCTKLKQLADDLGVDCQLHEYSGMIHDWIIFPLPQTQEARSHLVRKLKDLNTSE